MPRTRYKSILGYLSFTLLVAPVVGLAVSSWQGPYVGAYFGDGLGNTHVSTNVGAVTSTSYFTTTADISAVNTAGTWTTTPNKAIGGIQAGHDWIWQQVVYGIVLDYGALPLSSSNNVNKTYPDNSDSYSVYTAMSTDWLFTLRARAGYATRLYWPALLYLTAGMAMTEFSLNNNFSDTSAYAGIGGGTTSQNKIGWTAGVGLELVSLGNASINLEYLYIHMPSVKLTNTITNTQGGFGIPEQSLTSPFPITGRFHANILKLGLNYRF